MPREIQKPKRVEKDGSAVDGEYEESHPAFGLASVHRSSVMPGAVLFDSDIKHRNTMTLRIATASRRRGLSSDYLYREDELIEVEFSEAQWGAFVSSINAGSGVACTIRRTEGQVSVPDLPYEPRMQESIAEVRESADKTYNRIVEALDAYLETRKAPERRTLEMAIRNAPANVEFSSKMLNEHAENVVTKAKADIEAAVDSRARQLGIDPSELGVPQLGPGDDS